VLGATKNSALAKRERRRTSYCDGPTSSKRKLPKQTARANCPGKLSLRGHLQRRAVAASFPLRGLTRSLLWNNLVDYYVATSSAASARS
jgi:hypothetical protein